MAKLLNRAHLTKYKSPLAQVAHQIAQQWAKGKTGKDPIVIPNTKKHIKKAEARSLGEMRVAIFVGGKKPNNYDYKGLKEIIESVVAGYPTVEFDGKVIKVKEAKKAKKDESK